MPSGVVSYGPLDTILTVDIRPDISPCLLCSLLIGLRRGGDNLSVAARYGPDVFKVLLDYGKKICDEHPIMFRDLYIYHSDFGRTLFELAQDVEILSEIWSEKLDKKGLRDHLDEVLNDEEQVAFKTDKAVLKNILGKKCATRWLGEIRRNPDKAATPAHDPYCKVIREDLHFDRELKTHTPAQWYELQRDIPWSFFLYLRTLPPSPLDPILQTNQVDPVRANLVYRTVGLWCAVASDYPGFQLSVDVLPVFVDYQRWLRENVDALSGTQRVSEKSFLYCLHVYDEPRVPYPDRSKDREELEENWEKYDAEWTRERRWELEADGDVDNTNVARENAVYFCLGV